MAVNEDFPLALSQGTVLAGQYVIEKVLGQGGFGITYMATDHKTGEKVAVKEFFPDTLAYREKTQVISYPGERDENFQYGKDGFLQEAQTLAQFLENKNIVHIHSYFEENGTAYFVMDYIEGTSFDDYLKQHGGKISVLEAEKILIPIMDALDAVHAKGIVHRDVTPDNIYICNDGTVKLLDFGAARYSLGDKSKSLDVILKHGFAPKEQYTRHGRQGPYTDIYSLAATFYFAITGRRPPDSVDRLDEDDLIPPSSLGVEITDYQEKALFTALEVQPHNRFASMAVFKKVLLNEDPMQAQALTGYANIPVTSVGNTVSANIPVTSVGNTLSSGIPVTAVGSTVSASIPVSAVGNTVYDVPNNMTGTTVGIPAGTGNADAAAASAEKKTSGKVIAIASIAAVLVLGIAAAILVPSHLKKDDDSSKNDSVNDVIVQDTGNTSTNETDSLELAPSDTSTQTEAPQTEPPVETETPAETQPPAQTDPTTSSGNMELLGYTGNGNLLNGGIYCSDGESRYFVSDNRHRIYKDTSAYITNDKSELSNLCRIDNRLYFIAGGRACYYEDGASETNYVDVLADYKNIKRMYITEDYYFIYVSEGSGSGELYRIPKDGEWEERMPIDSETDFTIFGGYVYCKHVGDDGKMGIFKFQADNFSESGRGITFDDYTPGYPVVDNGYLYVVINSNDGKSSKICKIDASTMKATTEISFDLKKVITSDDFSVEEMNAYNNNVFFILNDVDNGIYDLYHMTITDNGTKFNVKRLNTTIESGISISKYKNGDLKVSYMAYDENSDIKSYYMRLDSEGNVITD